ncbi:MAG: flagellar hook-associated protein FlgK [Thioalkalispiraceae bacterium]|jgi:flagellar hook-associated protein 1 FlgK
MAGDLLGTSTSGVIAAQRALSTTGHNIANATTEGYSRQRAELEARKPTFSGNGSIGTGVLVDNVSRHYDEFVVSELRNTTSQSKFLDKSYEFTSQVDNLLADPRAGLAPSLSDFFQSVNGLANDPSSTASRQVMLSSARNLSDRFEHMNTRLDSLRSATNKDMEVMVGQVNELAKGIAELNNAIVRSREVTDKPANDLLDQRDRLVQQLSELINVRTTIQEDDRMNVFVGNGQTLVVADTASKLDVQLNEYDPSQSEVVFVGSGGNTVITQYLTGGALGGITKFRNEILDPTQNELGRIAIGVAKTFNEQHKLGMDLNSQIGRNFFSEIDIDSPIVLPSMNNKGDLELDVEVIDVDKLKASNYQLTYIQGQYELLRIDDAKVVGRFSSLPQEIKDDGIKITIKGGGNVEELDKYIIQPTRRSAELFGVEIHSGAEIAASSPIRVEADIDNLGDADIEVTQITSTDNPTFKTTAGQLSPPYLVRFVDDSNFEILDNSGKPVRVKLDATADDPAIDLNAIDGATPAVPASETGETAIPALPPQRVRDEKAGQADKLGGIEGPIAYDAREGTQIFPTAGGIDRGIHIKVTGKPKAGDIFRIEFNKDGTSDNKNALALAELQIKPTLMNGTADYTQTYGQLVSRVGSRTHELDLNRKAQSLLLDQAIEEREAVSGVNLDEEAAELIRFQNLYQANAQVIAAAKQTFQVLLDAFR